MILNLKNSPFLDKFSNSYNFKLNSNPCEINKVLKVLLDLKKKKVLY